MKFFFKKFNSQFVKVFFSCLILWQVSFFLQAQEKVEIEKQIKESEVPEPAVSWIREAFAEGVKIKWVREYSANQCSYEAKLKWGKHWHSVEFCENGQIEDIEIEVRISELDTAVLNRINSFLVSTYLKSKLIRIQKQYSGSSDQLLQFIKHGTIKELISRYEVEFYGKTEKEDGFYEGLFDAQGKIIQSWKISQLSSGNFEY